MRDPILRQELAKHGIFFSPNAVLGYDNMNDAAQVARYERMKGDYTIALDAFPHLKLALDAQPTLQTTANAGVLLSAVSIIDPEVVRVIFTPMRAAQILGGESQKGTWVDQVMYFPMAEATGQVATYGDYSQNGSVDFNAAWNFRQPYNFQAFKRYGEQTLARWGAAGLNYSAELDQSLALVFAKFMNKTYFYGVSGLINYGLLNDPSLPASISPGTKVDTSQGVTWLKATALEIYNDVLALYGKLVTQMGGNVEMTDEMKLVVSTTRQPRLLATNDYGISVFDLLKKAFPNLTIEAAPEYTTQPGELMQLILPKVDGVQTAYPAYNEKLRAHALIAEPSAWSQKNSGGTWGTIIRRPIAIASMLGI